MKLLITLGKILGSISLIFPRKMAWPCYLIKRGFITARLKGGLKHLGKDSLLAPGVKIYNGRNISIGNGSSIMSHCILETTAIGDCAPHLSIGDGCSIGEYSHITCANKVIIGNGLLTGRFVLITDNSHGDSSPEECDTAPLARDVCSKGPVEIKDNVWIGDKATILPGITIGKGAIIAANAVVTKDIPDYAIAAGIPAKIVKHIK